MSLTLKVTHKGISRVIQFDKGTSAELSFARLQASITAVFPALKTESFCLTRQDEDGDLVEVSSDAELTETVRMFQASTKPTKGSCPRFTVKVDADPAAAATAAPASAPAIAKAPTSGERAHVVPSAPPAPSNTEDSSGDINWALPKYEKYRKMLTMFSEKPVRDKMKGDKEGFTPEQLDAFFAQYGKPGGQSAPPVQAPAPAPYNPYADPNYKIPSVFRVVEPPINWNAAKYSKYRRLKGVLFEGGIRKRLYDDGFTNDEIEAYFQPWPGVADETTIVGALLKIAIGGVQAAPLAVSNEQHRHDAPKHHPAPPVYAEMQAVDGQWVPLHQGQMFSQLEEYDTVHVCKEAVPNYLRNSVFYKSLSDADNEDFSIPAACYKSNTEISSVSDMKSLLSTLRFWGADSIPHDLVCYFVAGEISSDMQLAAQSFETELPYVKVLLALNTMEEGDRLKYALRSGFVEIIQVLFESGYQWSGDSFQQLIPTGKLACIEYLATHGCPRPVNCIRWASSYGHLELVRYMHEQGFQWGRHACTAAAEHGHLSCLKYLHEAGCRWCALALEHAAGNGHIDCLRYAHQHGCPWTANTVNAPARNGQVHCLLYLLEQGCPTNITAIVLAARHGKVDCLRVLLEAGCPWSETALYYAAFNGHLECLRCMHEHGCVWTTAAIRGAVSGGQMHCLVYAHECECPWDAKCAQEAAAAGQLECLKYLREHRCPWDARAAEAAAEKRHWECWYFIRDNLGIISDKAEALAAASGQW